jgi:hypothetical protein
MKENGEEDPCTKNPLEVKKEKSSTGSCEQFLHPRLSPPFVTFFGNF